MSGKFIHNFTKGSILLYLKNRIKFFSLPKTYLITVEDWTNDKEKILKIVLKEFNKSKFLAIRSSSINEDQKKFSQAGKYYSELFVNSKNISKITTSINKVISKYETKNLNKNQIIIQEMILNTDISGVIFSRESNTNAPYYVINYDDVSGLTNTVTSGTTENSNKSLNVYRDQFKKLRSPRFKKLIIAVRELEKILGTNELDIEFCIKELKIYLLQVRPLTNLKIWDKKQDKLFLKVIKSIEDKIQVKSKKEPGIYGKKNIFGQMPDWNPAEIIGLNPNPLAYSLYKRLITDKTWAIAREKMDYKSPKDQSLMISLGGLPYINTKLSFNSFLHKKINNEISSKLVNYWIEKLKFNPKLHDKIEFEIAITCFSFDIDKRIEKQVGNILKKKEKNLFKNILTQHFKDIIKDNHVGSIKYNLNLINNLKKRQDDKNYNKNIKVLIKDCIRYGTIPFSILARHAFISKSILNSLQNLKIISNNDLIKFYSNISTVATNFIQDVSNLNKRKISRKKFNLLYGHLRPGTYDILSKRYDETNYINFSNLNNIKIKRIKENIFLKSQKIKISRLLKKFQINITTQELINYLKISFSSREYAKFIFSKNVSEILKIIKKDSLKKGLKKNDIPFLELKNFNSNFSELSLSKIQKKIKMNKENYFISRALKLPQLIHDSKGAYIAPFQINTPNFISNRKVSGNIMDLTINNTKKINDKIILIENADPGYDWIFTYKIKGLITKYGGVNSHMAIRCREFNLPAAIGCGPQLYDKIKNYKNITLDCLVNKIET